jgi:hypothetical protein
VGTAQPTGPEYDVVRIPSWPAGAIGTLQFAQARDGGAGAARGGGGAAGIGGPGDGGYDEGGGGVGGAGAATGGAGGGGAGAGGAAATGVPHCVQNALLAGSGLPQVEQLDVGTTTARCPRG